MKQGKKFGTNKILLLVFILTIFSIIINGYFYGAIGNTQWTIPIIKSFADKELFEHDLLAGREAFSSGPYYYSFEVLVAPLTRIIDIQIIFFVIFFFSVFFFLLGVFYLAKLLFNNDYVALLAVLLVMVRKPALATSTFLPNFAARMIVLPFFILAIIMLIKKRYYATSLISGLAMNLHPILTLPFYSLIGLYFVINYKKIGIRKILASFALFFVAALPIFIWRVINPMPAGSLLAASDNVLEMLRITGQGRHIFPLYWPIGRWIRYFVFILAFIVALRFVSKNDKHNKMKALFYGTFLIFIVEIINEHFLPRPISFLLILEIMRSSIFPVFIGCIYMANYLANLYPKDNFSKFVSVGIGVSVFLSNFKALALFLILLLTYNYKKNKFLFNSGIAVFVAGFVLSVAASFTNIGVFSALRIGSAPSITILACMFVFFSFKNFGMRIGAIPLVVILALVLGSFFAVLQRQALEKRDTQLGEFFMLDYKIAGSPLSKSNLENFLKSPLYYLQKSVEFPRHVPQNDWEGLQVWALQNTKKNAVFITPPQLNGFRVYSERSTVVDCEDRSQSNPHYVHGYEWIDRIKLVCRQNKLSDMCEDYCKESYGKNSKTDFLMIASKYNTSYIVTEKHIKLDLPIVYINNGFNVYSIVTD